MTTKGIRIRTVAAACLGWLFSAVDIILLILFQDEVTAALGVEPQAVRIAIGVGLLGSAFGGLFFAQLGDRIGRVRALGWCVILYSVATAGMALAPNLAVLIALRFLAGVGTGGEWSLGFALIAEVWPRERRGTLGGFVAAMFNIGTFVAIMLYQSPLGWRLSFAVMFLPALGVIWLRRSVPEPQVWTRLQQARASGEVSPQLARTLDKAPIRALFSGGFVGVTLATTLIFLLMNFTFYGFATVFMNYLQFDVANGGLGLDKAGQMPYQLTLNLAGLVAAIAAGYLSDKLGRRSIFAVFCLIGVVGHAMLFSLTHSVCEQNI